ncbi:MAG TPA: MmcQ/YjbR family DNA-binding protein [Pedococcus sp.]|jgi:hypothetical protein|uniref:MmcQ/YjbR family DNA-binding protein n=1 Tax=Pedococcus sp. TaxID=2860345 RepID=UPI002F9445BA
MPPASPLQRVRRLCLAFPGTEERLSHGEPTWFAGGRKSFVMYADHHHDEREALWAAAPEGAQGALVAEEPARYFRPPYVGTRGWVGVYLDVPDVDWPRVEEIIEDAWRCVAGRRLQAGHDADARPRS